MKIKIKSIPAKKRLRYKLPIIVALLIIPVIAIGTIWLIPHSISKPVDTNNYDYELEYNDDMGIPGESYHIQIDTKSKALLVTVTRYCSAIDCDTSTDKYGPTILTNEEYTKIFSAIKDRVDMKFIAPILESMARDQEPFDGHLVGNATTRREFANQWLNDVIEELHK